MIQPNWVRLGAARAYQPNVVKLKRAVVHCCIVSDDFDPVKTTRDTYNNSATKYAAHMGTYRPFPGLREQLRSFIALTDPNLPILDAGCGPGRDSVEIVVSGRRVIALDASVEMLLSSPPELSRQDLGLLQSMRFRVAGDLRAIPLRQGCLGGIWACASLMHLPSRDLEGALKQMCELLTRNAPIRASFKAQGGSGLVAGGAGISGSSYLRWG